MQAFGRALVGLYLPARGRAGQGLVEYSLILGFVAVLVLVALLFLRGEFAGLFSRVGNSLAGPAGPAGPSGPFACPPPSQNPNCTP